KRNSQVAAAQRVDLSELRPTSCDAHFLSSRQVRHFEQVQKPGLIDSWTELEHLRIITIQQTPQLIFGAHLVLQSGSKGTVLISVTSSTRRLACHWWNRYSGS